MEQIFIGIIKSDQPITVKNAIITKISDAATNNSNEETCCNILQACFDVLFSDSFNIDLQLYNMVQCVLISWVKQNKEFTMKFMNKAFFQLSVDKIDKEAAIKHLRMINYAIKIINTSYELRSLPFKGILKDYLYLSFTQISDLELLSVSCELYLQNPILIPDGISFASKLEVVKVVITTVGTNPFVFFNEGGKEDDSQMKCLDKVFELFSKYVAYDVKLMKYAASLIFKLISNQDIQPSISLVRFLPCLRLDMLSQDLEDMMMTVCDSSLKQTLSNMVDWICFPLQDLKVDQWVTEFMKYLIKYRKLGVLFSIVENKIKQVCNLIYFPALQRGAVSLMTFMLISYLQSPRPFHQVSTVFPSLMEHLKKDGRESAMQTLQVLVELTHTLMYHFSGYPDVYEPLLAAVEGHAKPSEKDMKMWLEASLSIPRIDFPDVIIGKKKSETGKVGLENLGNTCYMNSVIQALFNLSSMKNEVITGTFLNSSQPVTTSLQHLFALLQLSERPAATPRQFYKQSRPPWFQEGSQQDCSEYLKYLLDKVQHETAESARKLDRWFTGEINTTVECLTCHTVSCKKEVFNDLPLSFAASMNEASGSDICTLKGGDSSERTDQKMHCEIAQPSGSIEEVRHIPPDMSATMTSNGYGCQSVVDMLNKYFLPELLKDSNKYFCERCSSLQNACKYMDFVQFPTYLILTLKRFTYDVKAQKRSKILQTVNYPRTLSICEGCSLCDQEKSTGSDGQSSERMTKTITSSAGCHASEKYQLSSVVVHSGYSSDSGHYYCYTCKHSQDGSSRWCLMNDSRISFAATDCLSKLGSNFPRDTPYVCIYEKNEDSNQSSESINVPKQLLDMVMDDNLRYAQELKEEVTRRKRAFVFPRKPPGNDGDNDDDSFGPYGGSFGGGGWDSGKFIC